MNTCFGQRWIVHLLIVCLSAASIGSGRAQQTPTITFTVSGRADVEIPPGWETVAIKRCKPIITRVTVRLYRLRIPQGYKKVSESPLPSDLNNGFLGIELDGRSPYNLGKPTPGGRLLRQRIFDDLVGISANEINRFDALRAQDPLWQFTRADHDINAMYARSSAANDPRSLKLQQLPQDLRSIPPNVRLVDPRSGRTISLTPQSIERTLQDYGLWHFNVWDVTEGSYSTKLIEITVDWTFEIPIDPNQQGTGFLGAQFSGLPAPDGGGGGGGGGGGQTNPAPTPPSAPAKPMPTGPTAEGQGGSPGGTSPQTTGDTAQKADAQAPQAVSVIASLFGISPDMVAALAKQPGIDVVAGIAIPDNGPTGIAGAVAFEDRRDPCGDTPPPLSWKTITRNLGLMAAHTFGNRGAYVIAPSLRVGSSAWLFAGGAFGDSNGNTRQAFIGGVTVRISNLLGGGAGSNGSQNTPKLATVEAKRNPTADLGSPSHRQTDGLLVISQAAPSTGADRTVTVTYTDNAVVLVLKRNASIDFYRVPPGTIKRIVVTEAAGTEVAHYDAAAMPTMQNLNITGHGAAVVTAPGITLPVGEYVRIDVTK